jgi:putative FmdB family regulatory protein
MRRNKIPIYEYKCGKCGAAVEKLQKFSDAPLTKCEECGEEALEKVLSQGTGFLLKGYGWERPGLRAGIKKDYGNS